MTPPLSPPLTRSPTMALIAAVARNGVIGHAGGLAWHESADQRHFRQTTEGHAVLMGRKTWDSLPARFRPLPKRRNLVLSRQPGLQLPGAEVHPSLQAALATLAALQGSARVFVIGGGELYAQALPLASELVLTEIDADLDGDTHFPPIDRTHWLETGRVAAVTDSGQRYAFVHYRRQP